MIKNIAGNGFYAVMAVSGAPRAEATSAGACPTATLLRFNTVAKSYDGKTFAVRDLSFDVRQGEFLTLLGPSGSGKTTTLMMVAGFEGPSSGEILLEGSRLDIVPPHQRNFGMVFQDYALFPHMTVEKNLAYPLRVRSIGGVEAKQKVDRILDLLQLTPYRDRLPRQLSGGQQQRVALGRALIFSPRLVLMDEPLGALDRQLRERMQVEIKHLHQQLGITIISVTHDQGEALTMSDRIAVFRHGELQQIGAPGDLYERPANAFIASFLGDSNFIPGVLVEVTDSQSKVRCSDGTVLKARSADAGAVGSEVAVCIRPERVKLSRTAAASDNSVSATVLERLYFGDSVKLRLRVSGSDAFLVKIPVDQMNSDFSEGAHLHASWNTEHSFAFRGVT